MRNRRMFLQAGAALAVPVVGSMLIDRDTGLVEAACRGCADDPVAAEALRQFKAAVGGLTATAKGEHARQAAAALRVAAAHNHARKGDAEFRRALEREIRTYGRDNLLMRPFDREAFAATAREFGLSSPPELRTGIPLAERRQALDALLAVGVTAHLERAARFFEVAGAELDARGPLRLAQTKEEQIAACRNIQNLMFQSEIAMIIACIGGGPIACAYFSGVYIGVKYYYDYQTECSRWL